MGITDNAVSLAIDLSENVSTPDHVIYSDLRVIDIECESKEEEISLFETCTFIKPINLIVDSTSRLIFPAEMKIRSIQSTCACQVRCGGNLYLLTENEFRIISPIDLQIDAKYGDRPCEFNKIIQDEFGIHSTISWDLTDDDDWSEIIGRSMPISVYSNSVKLGVVRFNVVYDAFAHALLNANDTLMYTGDVPYNFSDDASLNVINRLQDLKSLTIDGNVGEKAFAELDFDEINITIMGEVAAHAFEGSQGHIYHISIKTMNLAAFNDCDELHIDTIKVGSFCGDNGSIISCDVAIIRDSEMAKQFDPENIIITETFNTPLKLTSECIETVDFRVVKSTGPFTIVHSTKGDNYFESPSKLTYEGETGVSILLGYGRTLEDVLDLDSNMVLEIEDDKDLPISTPIFRPCDVKIYSIKPTDNNNAPARRSLVGSISVKLNSQMYSKGSAIGFGICMFFWSMFLTISIMTAKLHRM